VPDAHHEEFFQAAFRELLLNEGEQACDYGHFVHCRKVVQNRPCVQFEQSR
jgi:hypothetical protein